MRSSSEAATNSSALRIREEPTAQLCWMGWGLKALLPFPAGRRHHGATFLFSALPAALELEGSLGTGTAASWQRRVAAEKGRYR